MTALMFACRFKQREIFDLLLEKCDRKVINTQDNMGYSALIWACKQTPDPYMIRRLIQKGADVSLRTTHHTTALDVANEYGADEPMRTYLLY